MGTTIGIGIGIVFLNGVSGAQLSFAGSLTVEKGSAGPHFTLVVLNNPATNPYDGFAEVTDADGVSTLANGDEVTISGALGAHAVSYKATSSGGRPDLTIALTITIQDTVAPVLTLPTDTKTGGTTATLTVTTDTGEGTLYTVCTTSSTPPSAAQVIAGQDHSGVAAAFANSVAVASTGLKTVSATGLVAATAYTTFFVQKDASNNVSLVSAADGFTTDSGAVLTWNASDKSPAITLSNGNLDAASSGSAGTAWSSVRANSPKSTGKFYFEVFDVSGPDADGTQPGGGLSTTAHVLADGDYLGSFATSFMIKNDGILNNGFTVVGTSNPTMGINSVLGFAVDLDAGKIWIAAGNVYLDSGNPGAGTNPYLTFSGGSLTLVPGASFLYVTASPVARLHANTSNQTYSPPTGFSAWGGA